MEEQHLVSQVCVSLLAHYIIVLYKKKKNECVCVWEKNNHSHSPIVCINVCAQCQECCNITHTTRWRRSRLSDSIAAAPNDGNGVCFFCLHLVSIECPRFRIFDFLLSFPSDLTRSFFFPFHSPIIFLASQPSGPLHLIYSLCDEHTIRRWRVCGALFVLSVAHSSTPAPNMWEMNIENGWQHCLCCGRNVDKVAAYQRFRLRLWQFQETQQQQRNSHLEPTTDNDSTYI